MLKRISVLTAAFTAAALAAVATPAQAIPTLPPAVSDTLLVTASFSDAARTQLVGQTWSGCGKPSGSWGITTAYRSVFFPPC